MSWLAGTWRGRGTASYPQAGTFHYVEELKITPETDWNMLSVLQRTWLAEDDDPKKALHLESGIILVRGDGSFVYSCGQDSGRTEVMTGVFETVDHGLRIDWITEAHSNDSRLLKMGRTWWLAQTSLRYEAYLSTVRNPEYRKHLEAELHRDP